MEDVPRAKPQIGVLCIDVAKRLLELFPNNDIRSYIPVSYVKYLEGAGADVVPIWIGRSFAYYEAILKQLNGVLIPGGAVHFLPKSEFPNDCVEASKFIYELAKKQNDDGIYFPIWGTCLGFQLMLYHSAKGEETHKIRCNCERMDCSLPIIFEPNYYRSKMFLNLTEKMKKTMETEPFCCHYHRYCIKRECLKLFQIDDEWEILATNRDAKDLEFITFIEHKRYPFYGSQVHLERVEYEFMGETDTCYYTEPCIEASQYFAKFFIEECMKCPNCFDNELDRQQHSIRNFSPTTTRNDIELHWSECFLFDAQNSKYPEETI